MPRIREPLRVDAGSGPGSPRSPSGRASAPRVPASRSGGRRVADGDGSGRVWPCCSPWRRRYRSCADRTGTPLAQARALLDRFDKQPNVDQAIGLLSPVVAASPKDHVARTMLAEAYLRKFEYVPDQTLAARAGEEAGVALTLNQSYAPAHVVLAMINYSQGRFDGALGEAQNAVALDAKYSRAWRERGRALVRLGRRDEAEKDFLAAVALDPDDWTSRNGLGALYLSVNRLDAAVAEFERMRDLAPDNTRAYNNLGSAFLQQERFDKATEMYERSLSLDKNATAYSNLGTALYQQGLYADAARSFEGAVALPGATFLHWFNLGAACYWAPDRGRAKEAYETAVKLGEAGASRRGRGRSRPPGGLASGYAVLAQLPTGPKRRSIGAGPQPHCAHRAATPRCGRALPPSPRTYEELGDRPRRWNGSSRPSRQVLTQEDRTIAVVERAAGRCTIQPAATVATKEHSDGKSTRVRLRGRDDE